MKNALLSTLAAACLCATAAAHAASMDTTTPYPTSGETISLKPNTTWPTYIPTASYSRQGNLFTFELDVSDGFFTSGGFGSAPIEVGALPPGTYTAYMRMRTVGQDDAPPQYATSYFVVAAPYQPDAYAAPAQPAAYANWSAVLSSAYYVYPMSLRTSVEGSVVRVSFEYEPAYPTSSGGPAPAGTTAFASVPVQGLAPGVYTLQFNGTPRGANGVTLQYAKSIEVRRESRTVEYYEEASGHYYLTADPAEVNRLDTPGSGWRRTGEGFNVWMNANVAPPNAMPACHFYLSTSNSHFYSVNTADCELLKSIEAKERQGDKAYTGWTYMGTAFYALAPVNGQCGSGTTTVWRFYNNGAGQNDANHRFPVTTGVQNAMFSSSWNADGAAFCAPL